MPAAVTLQYLIKLCERPAPHTEGTKKAQSTMRPARRANRAYSLSGLFAFQ
jgi:hypothetical protein